MKKIIFPATNRVHNSRQKLLISELKKYFEVDVWIPKEETGGMSINSIFYSIQFNNYLVKNKFDYAIIRGDRYEMLPLAALCVYRRIPIIHIEGGDLSGVIDNKIRHAITHLADYHFTTNKESQRRLINMGMDIERVWNYGSLDVEFADKVKPKKLKEGKYIFVAYHPIEGEDENKLDKALETFKENAIIRVGSNKDYGRGYGDETFTPEDYINLMRGASCCVGNSSSLLKEASVLGIGVVLVGDRQHSRLPPHNVVHVPCETNNIIKGIIFQMQNKYKKDLTYFKKDTSKQMTKKLKEIL